MKKTFGDLLAILSSILLGVLVRDFDTLCENLTGLFEWRSWHVSAQLIAWLTGIVMIGVFLRNIHGAVCFQDFLHQKRVKSALDSTPGSRALTFGLSLASLFGGPALAGHYVLHHISFGTNHVVASAMNGTAFTIVLFLSFGVYMVWDLLLWMFGTDGTPNEDFDRIVRRWVVIDASALIAWFFVGCIDLYRSGHGLPFNYEIAALSFIAIALTVVTVDYTINKEFYFAK